MSFRPVCDVWILGRPKVRYYGAYPSGFLERARVLLVGNDPEAAILHVCGGKSKEYNGKKGGITLSGFGKNDKTLDLDPALKPDFLMDARDISRAGLAGKFRAILIDRPYSLSDAEHYTPGPDVLPNINRLTADCLEIAPVVGVIDYVWPSPKNGRELFLVAVGTGRNNRARWFTGWKRVSKN